MKKYKIEKDVSIKNDIITLDERDSKTMSNIIKRTVFASLIITGITFLFVDAVICFWAIAIVASIGSRFENSIDRYHLGLEVGYNNVKGFDIAALVLLVIEWTVDTIFYLEQLNIH